jgi:wyosine [tRNA(Phe)-imidazoG37] synthetase (radical SAM superfamily)
MKYLFGPVPSRRLGISLGVDLVPLKVCTLNCVYCEVGRTTNLTIERKEYVPIDEVIEELEDYLSDNPQLDYITFSGQGEPTLNSGIEKIIKFVKEKYPQYKLALITNGTLFYDEKLRKEVMDVDMILPSLDAAITNSFIKVDRPSPDLKLDKIIGGLIDLRKDFKGEIFLEVFIVPGLNDSADDIIALKDVIKKINPDLVQLNTLDRPGTESWVVAESGETLKEIAENLLPLKVDIISKYHARTEIESYNSNVEEFILKTIQRRPCTDKDLKDILNIHINEINKYLSQLLKDEKIVAEKSERGTFFKIK